MFTVTLELLLRRGLELDAHEAVAIVLGIGSAGIPRIDNVEVRSDGSVTCILPTGTPTVRDVAALLQRLLPAGARVPPPLRYAIGRGLGEVEAPPFESLEAFSTVLRRFESGERTAVIRGLLQRAARPSPQAEVPIAQARPRPDVAIAPVRPQRPAPPVRPLSQEPAAGAVIFHTPPPHPSRRRSWLAVGMGAALLASALAGYTAVRVVNRAPERAVIAPPAPVATAGREPRAPSGSGPRAALPVRVLGDREGPAFSPAFSPSGTALFFQTADRQGSRSAIAMASTSSWPDGALRIMTIVDDGSRNYHAHPSPDGQLLAFDSDRDGERGIYLAYRDGSHVRRISGRGYAALPTWSPDGTRLTYIRAEVDRPAVWNLWVQAVDGGEETARRITRYRYGQTWSASWFPDNARICYTHEDTLTILDLETGRTRQFASPIKDALVRTPAVSPDGSTIVFQVFRHGVWMLNLADGAMRCVLTDPTAEEFAWTPDGTRIAFHSKRDGRWGIYLLARG
jgi:WD40-like Beta Propeller Repeat